jgi:hypothetical protein
MPIANGQNPTLPRLNVYDGALQGGNTYSSDTIANILAYTSCTTAGVRQGVMNVGIYRASTDVLATWDGNKDIAMKITAYNSAANGTNGGIEGLEILVRNTGTGATNALVKGMNVTAENKTGAGTVTELLTAMFTMKNNGVVATSVYGVVIQEESQGTNPAATAMLRFTTATANPASGATPSVINIAAKNTAGFTYLVYAESATLDCATVGAGTYSTADGYFSVKVGANVYRVPFFTTVD